LNSGTQLNPTPNDQSAQISLTTVSMRAAVTHVGSFGNCHFGTAQAYAPKLNGDIGTPEPSRLALSALGCFGAGLALRRRRRKRYVNSRRWTQNPDARRSVSGCTPHGIVITVLVRPITPAENAALPPDFWAASHSIAGRCGSMSSANNSADDTSGAS
jgi:hypothetical protein